MTVNARDALRHLVASLEVHLDAVIERRSADDAVVDDAFDAVAAAFERYEDVLDSEFGEALPMILDAEDSIDDDIDDEDLLDDDEEIGDLDEHAVEDEDDLDDDLDDFDLN